MRAAAHSAAALVFCNRAKFIFVGRSRAGNIVEIITLTDKIFLGNRMQGLERYPVKVLLALVKSVGGRTDFFKLLID